MESETRRKNTAAVLIFNAVLAFIFVRGEDLNFTDGTMREVLFIAAAVFLVVIVPLYVYFSPAAMKRISRIRTFVQAFFRNIASDPKRALLIFSLFPLTVLAAFLAAHLIAAMFSIPYNAILLQILTASFLILLMAWLLKGHIKDRPQLLFLSTALIAGTFMIVSRPCEVGYSWDDQIHFERTLSLATLDGPYYKADNLIYLNAWEPASKASEAERRERTELLNSSYEKGELYETPYHGNLGYLCIESYAPCALGIIFGRGIGLSYVSSLRCGLFFNLLFYCALFAFAMTKLRTGRILMAAVGLLPTNLFLVTSFSYDPWITAWIVLGFAYYFGFLQDENRTMSNTDMIVMIFAFWIGCLPKAIYFLLMFPLLFMPKRVFRSKKQRAVYYVLVFAAAGYLAGTFLMPILFSGFGTGDATGTAAVNSGSQVEYILSRPLTYGKILLDFLTDYYITPLKMGNYCVNYGYMGVGRTYYYIVPAILWLTALTDKDGRKTKTKAAFFSSAFAMFWLVVLIPTAMYISFTAYQSPTIEGCQPRYLIPLVFPALYLHSFDAFENKMDRRIYNAVPIVLIALIAVVDLGCMLYVKY